MRIACLQFSPQVGDIDNNLTRADAVLNKAKPEELGALDLLVLPEMAFSGYNFKSLQQIHPFLELSGSGISSLWTRITALRLDTNVVVGYPEKVDIRDRWPASPECYNSAIIVNGEGENVLNCRKRFLDKTDETWAVEGDGGFHRGEIPGLGKTVVGICTDLNPHRCEGPWNEFEFGFHALEVGADLIIVSMSCVTRQDNQEFSRMLAEPDMETLEYWVQGLEPLISAELDREIIVVFCNRCGQEEEALYAGTSAIIGIHGGEVNVYALAGRGTKEYLFADTSLPPFAKLVQSEDNNYESKQVGDMVAASEVARPASVGSLRWSVDLAEWFGLPSSTAAPSNAVGATTAPIGIARTPSFHSKPAAGALLAKKEKPSPKLQIPEQAGFSQAERQKHTEQESPSMIPTPTAPSPTPMAIRPELPIPDQNVANASFTRKPTPFPHDRYFLDQQRFLGSRAQSQVSASSTSLEEAHQGSRQVSTQASTSFYWKPSNILLKTPDRMSCSCSDTRTPDSPIANNNRGKAERRSAATSSRQEPATKQSQRPSPPSRVASAADNRVDRPEKTEDALHLVHTDSSQARNVSRTQGIRADSLSEQHFDNMYQPSRSCTVKGPLPDSVPTIVRPASRGRQRVASGQSPHRQDSKPANVSLAQNTKDMISSTRNVSVTRIHSPSRPAVVLKAKTEDDIVAVEEYVEPDGGQRFQRAPSASAPQQKMPSIADGWAILGAHCNLPPPPPVYPVDDDTRTRTPTVLGGTVKTTIITVPDGGSMDSITSPLPSATSIASTVSQTSESSQATPTTDMTTPDSSLYPWQRPWPVMTNYLLSEEKRTDTPIPDNRVACESPGPSSDHADEEWKRTRLNFW